MESPEFVNCAKCAMSGQLGVWSRLSLGDVYSIGGSSILKVIASLVSHDLLAINSCFYLSLVHKMAAASQSKYKHDFQGIS